MKTFYIDEQITIWRRSTYVINETDEANAIKHMLRVFEDDSEDGFVEAELLLGTEGRVKRKNLLTEDLNSLISQRC